jgi:hypothetical protein
MANEDFFINLARMTPDKDAVIIMDRGYLDNMAYLTQPQIEHFVNKHRINLPFIRDSRYDMVVHMVTAADGAERFYSLANNKARSESIDQARQRDVKTKDAWNGHPQHM